MRYLVLFASVTALLITHSFAVAEPMRFELEGNGGNYDGAEWLAAKGDIMPDSADQLSTYLREQKLTEWKGSVRFNSPGGNLIGGIKLGELIRKQGMSTEVGGSIPLDSARNWPHERTKGDCVSACAFAYLGGVERFFDEKEGNRVGIHQFYDLSALADPSAKLFNAIDFSTQQLLSALIVEYVMRMGVDPHLVIIAANTLPTDMHYLSHQEAEELKVAWSPETFDPWTIELRNDGVVAFSKTADRQTTVTLFCRSDRVPRALVTMPVISDAQNTIDLLSGNPRVDALGIKATSDRVKVTIKNDTAYWEINLKGIDPNNVGGRIGMENGSNFELRIFETPFSFMSSANLKRSARIAFRNCI
jgi:hypothetical protein